MSTYRLSTAVLSLSFFAAFIPGLVALRAQDAELHAELSDEQKGIRDTLLELSRRMDRAADKLKATQPEDAQRMKEAADRIQGSDLARVLDEVSALLGKGSFLEAIGLEDKALTEIDALIQLLERSAIESQETQRQLEEIAKLRQQVGQVTKKQEGLLERTKKLIEKARAVAGLKELKTEIDKLQAQQAGLDQGQDPEQLDRQGSAEDTKAMEQALELARRLEAAQKALGEKVAGLPEEQIPIAETRKLLERLEDALDRAGELTAKLRDAKAEQSDLASAKGRQAGSRPATSKDAPGTPTGDPAAKDAASKDAPPKDTAAKETAAKDTVPKDTAPKDTATKDAASKDGAPTDAASKDPSTAGQSASGKQAGGKESKSATAGESQKEPRDGPRSGPSDLELARREAELKEAQGTIGERGRELAEKLTELAKDAAAGSKTPAEARESLQAAAGEAPKTPEEAGRGQLEAALTRQEQVEKDIQRARDAVARQLAGMEEKNAGETAGLTQEQGLLAEEAKQGASQVQQGAQQSSGEASSQALEQGSQAMEQASQSMEKASQALEQGDRQGAKQAGQKAQQDLARAQAAIEEGLKKTASRSAEEKARDLQKKLARQAEAARQRVAELQKKLRKKGEPQGGLEASEAALGEASRAMDEAAQAGAKDPSLAKKKRGEALDQLEKASSGLAEEERDALERLQKESAKKDAPEQEQLARLTKELGKDAKKSSNAEAGEQGESLDQASGSMEQASESLEEEKPEEAAKKQEEALARLKGAEEELEREEEKLAQLKREQEMLSLVDSLTDIKERQEKINTETSQVAVEAAREPRASRRQAQRRKDRIDKLVTLQGELAGEVDGLGGKLKEELARVFTFVLRGVSTDMRQVAEGLKELDPYTEFLEKEIVRDLDRLIAMLKEQAEQPPPEPSEGPPPPPGRPRLVPVVAELRVLREMQEDVNRSTRDLEDLRQAQEGKPSDSWAKALDRLLQKQGSVSRMTAELIKDFQAAQKAEGAAEEGQETEEHAH